MHWGIFHWWTACWHRTTKTWLNPGHGITMDKCGTKDVNECCVCGRIKPFSWAVL